MGSSWIPPLSSAHPSHLLRQEIHKSKKSLNLHKPSLYVGSIALQAYSCLWKVRSWHQKGAIRGLRYLVILECSFHSRVHLRMLTIEMTLDADEAPLERLPIMNTQGTSASSSLGIFLQIASPSYTVIPCSAFQTGRIKAIFSFFWCYCHCLLLPSVFHGFNFSSVAEVLELLVSEPQKCSACSVAFCKIKTWIYPLCCQTK